MALILTPWGPHRALLSRDRLGDMACPPTYGASGRGGSSQHLVSRHLPWAGSVSSLSSLLMWPKVFPKPSAQAF